MMLRRLSSSVERSTVSGMSGEPIVSYAVPLDSVRVVVISLETAAGANSSSAYTTRPPQIGDDVGEHWHAARLDLLRVRSVDGEQQPHDAVQVLAIVSAELIGQCYIAGFDVFEILSGDGDRLGEFPEQSEPIA